ncbi:MAG TPA: YciI family protein [Steroidobacteraceae bacterium]|jgi:hypothetical protein
MNYMMLIHHDDAALGKANQKELWADYAAFNDALAKAGGRSGVRLKPASAATSVRVRDGKTEIIDGPYADTKEKLAGYFMIDADSDAEAVAWAQRCPSARYGTIEVRPVMDVHQ